MPDLAAIRARPDKTPAAVLAEAIHRVWLGTIAAVIGDTALSDGEYARAKNDVHLDDDELAAAILAAMPNYTIVSKWHGDGDACTGPHCGNPEHWPKVDKR